MSDDMNQECPNCHALLDPSTPHTKCARTKEPSGRELSDKIDGLDRRLSATLSALMTEMMNVARESGRSVGAVDALKIRVDALESSEADRITRETGDGIYVDEIETLVPTTTFREGAAVSVAVRPPIAFDDEEDDYDPRAPEPVLAATTRAAREKENGGGGSDSPEVLDGPIVSGSPAPAASALPMPERPPWGALSQWDADDMIPENLALVNQVVEFALALESRLAEAEKQVEEERQSHLGAAHAWAEAADERDRRQKRIEEITIERDAFKEMLSSERKAKLAQVARVCDERDALKAKLAEKSEQLEALTETHDELLGKYAAMQTDRDALRAKLDEAEKALACNGIIPAYVVRDTIKPALAAAENTGDAGRTPAGQCSTDRSTDGQPPTSTEPAVDESGPVTNPAVSHPSTAPAFEMTLEQRTQLYSFLSMRTLGSRRERESFEACVTDLVRSELRKAREGYAQLCESQPGHSWCASAIRAASKEASDG